MPNPLNLSRVRRAGVLLAAGGALAVFPSAAQASAVDLGTAAPFVALGGSTVTNTGPSVLNGDLGVAPGTSLVGFGSPAVVNGTTHNNDGVARTAQSDLTTAYDEAAGQPVTAELTGKDLGGMTLTPGAYRFATSAQLTGAVTLDAEGDPKAQFVFQVGSTLTTASASSVRMINGGSPCNVYWQVGSSATLGSTTDFSGTVLALSSITLDNSATVEGRMLARNGAVTLDDNVLDAAACTAPASPPAATPTQAPTSAATPATATGTGSGEGTPPAAADGPGTNSNPGSGSGSGGSGSGSGSGSTVSTEPGSVTTTTPSGPGSGATTSAPRTSTPRTFEGTAKLVTHRPIDRCRSGFRATVRGQQIKRVVFWMGGRRIATRTGRRFQVDIRPTSSRHLIARVTFKDATRAQTLRFTSRACAEAILKPVYGPSQFAG